MDTWEEEDVLITVRAYPNPSKKHIETSCVAGVTTDGQLRRLYPIPDRLLTQDNRFSKYDIVTVRVCRPKNDPRPESRRVDVGRPIPKVGKIKPVNNWTDRNIWVEPFRADSMEHLKIEPDKISTARSLGLIRPSSVDRFEIVSTGQGDWTSDQKSILRQQPLFNNLPFVTLEYVPFKFYYRFHCENDSCRGHRLSIVDWEIAQAYRKWRNEYGDSWEDKMREKFEHELPSKDLQFFVGTVMAHPTKTWVIIGLYYPPKPSSLTAVNGQLPLFP